MNKNWIRQTLRPAIFVSVTRALNGDTDEDFTGVPLEDVARGFWRVGAKAGQCDLLVAVCDNEIRGVWEIDKRFGWHPMFAGAIPSRKPLKVDTTTKYCKVLDGKQIPEQALVGHKLTDIVGMTPLAFPFKYSFT